MTARDMAKYAAMRPYFKVVAEALHGLVDGDNFFDMRLYATKLGRRVRIRDVW